MNINRNNHNLINLTVKINNRNIIAILDSGAAVSLLSYQMCILLKLETIITKNISLVYGNDTKQICNTMVTTLVSFDRKSQKMEIYVVENLPVDLILGINFFEIFNLNVTFHGSKIDVQTNPDINYINNINVFDKTPICGEKIFYARALENFYIQPNSEKIIHLCIDIGQDGQMLFETFPPFIRLKNIFFCDSLVTVSNGMVCIMISNMNDFQVFVPKNMIIGQSIDPSAFDCIVHRINLVDTEQKKETDAYNYTINDKLPLDQQQSIKNILEKYHSLFARTLSEISQTNLMVHTIKLLPGSRPVHSRFIRRSPYEEQMIDTLAEDLWKADVLEPSKSSFSSPIVLIKKPDGQWRVVNDFRKLNLITEKDVYQLPNQSTVLQELGGHSYFSQLDVFSAYFQIPLDPSCRHVTAFLTSKGLYQYKVLPMGAVNSAAVFSRLADLAFRSMRHDCISWYLDDFCVLGRNFDHHLMNLEKVLERIKEINLRLKPSKCHFGLTEITFLGFDIDGQGIKPSMKKIKPILEMRPPKNVAETQAYLGMINFYRKHIKNHSLIAHPLFELIKKDVKFNWTPECQVAFDTFKKILTEPPVLALFDPQLEVILECDGSKNGVAGIISQVRDGKSVVIEYHSRSTNKCEKNYSATEIELLSVCFILSKARPYIFGRRFVLLSDHSCLRYLHNLRSATGKLARWYSYISEYDMEIRHRAGSKSGNVDGLSRLSLNETIPEDMDTDLDTKSIFIVKIPEEIFTRQLMIDEQHNDQYCSQIMKDIRNNKPRASTFAIQDEILVKRTKSFTNTRELVVVPVTLMNKLIKIYHDDSSHSMGLNTYLKMKSRFFHPKLFHKIDVYCRSCDRCQKRNPVTQLSPGSADLLETSNVPFEKVSIDLMGDFPITSDGNRYIFVAIDLATRFVVAKPIKDKTKETVANCLIENIFHQYGTPKVITSDRGPEFCNKLLKEITKVMGIDHHKTTSYHPNSNSIVERANRNIGVAIAKKVNQWHDNWDQVLSAIIFGLNTCYHTITKQIPFTLLYSTPVPHQTDILFPQSNSAFKIQREIIEEFRKKAENRIKISQLKVKEKRNESMIDIELNVGEKCLIKRLLVKKGLSTKFTDRYLGPFVVKEKLKDGLYRIESLDEKRKEQIVNRTQLKKYFERDTNGKNKMEIIEEEILADEELDAEAEISDISICTDTVQVYRNDQPISQEQSTTKEGNITTQNTLHPGSMPDESSVSGNTSFEDAMSHLSSNNDSTIIEESEQSSEPRTSTPISTRPQRSRTAPDRYTDDWGQHQQSGRGRQAAARSKR